ncbi:MAG: adenylate/guanylate cyclase domain-containing protein [Xanthobacteraceae bacterium]|jgi:class 3 adenylate cyclase/ABC-type lipoprotein export system ATPase subunit
MSDFKLWLQSVGLERYGEVFASHDIDLAVVPDLTEQDLEKLGLSLGHRRKFMAAAAKFRAAPASSPVASAQAQPVDQLAPAVERRQLTVVFVDLVGSTALGTELDPEDLIQLLRQYRDACTAVIVKYDGFIAQYLGDGILVYFGFPQAQEHAAERAVRAGLEIVEKVGQLKQPDGRALQARVGIATGLVVTGGATGVGTAGEETVVGDTPNLAARLQSLADPGCALVGPTTHQLTSNFFEFSFLGERAIKGFRDLISVWKVLGESAIENRFAAAHAAAAGPIVGRERELAFLYDSWQRATRGDGHVVLLAGEAGIGKSRLLEALAERVREEPHRLLRCQCSPYHRNSVLFPFKTLLRHRLDISRDLPTQENLDRISRMLERVGRHARSSTLLLAELLEVSSGDTLSSIEMTPNQRKEETLAILEDLLMAPLDGPVLLLLEDAHWSDQTTQTLIERLLKRIGREHALVLITHRPELKTNWSEHPQATLITCKQIGHEHCAALIRNVASRMQMDDTLIREIVTRSDGVPLFAEELTKAVLDLRSLGASAVPLTLQDSLMARLDRLERAKDIAQIASVIGRQFSYALLEATAGASDIDLRAALARLRESGLIFEAGNDCESSYSFNHSLVQEAAYESLSRSRRQSLHKEIAYHLESQSNATGESEPTVIAHHYSRAGEAEKSFHYWMLAADRSGQRLAFAESVANLTSALAEAERVADPKLRTRLKLDAQLRLGATLAIHKGPQTSEAGSALQEAKALAKAANAGPQLFQATWGLYLNAARNRRLDEVEVLSEELTTISREIDDEDFKIEALHHRWGTAYFFGQTAKLIEYAAEGVEHYDRDRHHKFSYVFAGHDPGACAYCSQAMGLGIAGRSRSVRPALDAGLALATSLQHPLTLAFFLSFACYAMHLVRDSNGCREFAEQLTQISARYDLPATHAVGLFTRGAADALQGDVTQALKQMEPSYEAALGYGFTGVLPGVILADALASADRNEEALTLVTGLLEKSSTPERGPFISELWRIRGEMALRQSAANSQEAGRFFRTALRIADEQGAHVFRLNAGIPLARMLAEGGRREEAKSVLDHAAAITLDEWDGPETAIAAQLRSDLD